LEKQKKKTFLYLLCMQNKNFFLKKNRWDVIANFIEEHSRGKYKRTGKEVLTKVKEYQKLGIYFF
jgi:hypothetical protein